MSQQTTAQARVIDPILTEVARGYTSPNAAVANVLFPTVSVGQRGGRILKFGKEDFQLVTTGRAPGANTRRVQFGYGSDPFALADYRLEGAVPVELMQEAQAVPGIDLAQIAIRRVQNLMALEREKAAADIARNASTYDSANKKTSWSTAGAKVWSDVGMTSGVYNSNPFADINTAREAIRGQIGVRPNTLVLGPKVLTALRSHPAVLDRLSTASDRPPATLAQLQALFELEQIVEGAAVYDAGASGFADVWGKDAILAYTTPASMAEMGSPSYGYTYQLQDYPVVEEAYLDRNTNTWYYPVANAAAPVLTGASAGYLFDEAVA